MEPIDKEILYRMLQHEEKLKWLPEYQENCTLSKDVVNGWINVTEKLQESVATEFGFISPADCYSAVYQMRTAHVKYSTEQRFQDVSVYVRNNKARLGNLQIGDTLPNTEICSFDTTPIKLHDVISDGYNVILASSHT